MKNKLLTFLTVTMLAGSIFVGCGGSEAGTETGANNGSSASTNTEANVSTEVNVDTEVETNSDDNTVKIDSNIEYTETVIAFLIANEADYDKSMVDGSDIPNATHEVEEYKVMLKEQVALYRKDKTIIGYAKPDTLMTFAQFSEEWGLVGSTDYSEIYHVLASDVIPVMEVVEETDAEIDNSEAKNDTNVMSDRVKAFFDKIRNGVIEDNKTIEEYGKQYPDMTMRYLEEANSSEGMDCVTVLYSRPDSEEDYAMAIDVIRQLVYNQGYSKYYIEYLGETSDTVEYNIYGGK